MELNIRGKELAYKTSKLSLFLIIFQKMSTEVIQVLRLSHKNF